MKHLEGKYNIALDPGVANLGYCVTTLNHDILKIDDNKALFGTIKYPEAETSAGRRGCRTARRNNDHKKIRVDALQDYFEEEIAKIDPEFLTRLNESGLVAGDKSTNSEYILFDDEDYSDKQYYDEYPTVQHLIKDIIEGKKIKDIRLIYLAILSEYKHRGNMNSKIRINPNNDIPLNELISDYCSQADKLFDIDLKIDEKEYEKVFFSNDKITNKGKALCEMSGYTTNSTEGMLCRLIINATIDFKNILGLNDSLKVKLSDLFDEEKDDQLRSEATSDIYDFIDLARNLYSAILLKKFLGPHKYPSQAKVALYDKHKADLACLKKALGADKASYNEVFNTSDDNSYKGYLKNSNKNAKPFFAKIKAIIERLCEAGMVSDADTDYILNEIENGTFLPKQRTAQNAIIPN